MGYTSKREFRVVEDANKHITYKAWINAKEEATSVFRDGEPCSVEQFNRAGELAVKLKLLKGFIPLKTKQNVQDQ